METNNNIEDEVFVATDGKKYRKVIKQFGELVEGEYVIGLDGQPTVLSHAFEEHVPESMYEIETDTGVTLKVSGNHLWYAVPHVDRDMYYYRLREGKRLGKKLTPSHSEILESALDDAPVEISIRDMFSALDVDFDKDKTLANGIIRVAEGIGHVAERNFYVDVLDGEDAFEKPTLKTSVSMYDSCRFAQQLLSYFNVKNYRKVYPLLVGRVMTTDELAQYAPGEVYIPDPE